MSILSAKNLVFSSLTTPQARVHIIFCFNLPLLNGFQGIMASSLGLTFLSGVVVFAALTFYAPSLVMESCVRYRDNISDFDLHSL